MNEGGDCGLFTSQNVPANAAFCFCKVFWIISSSHFYNVKTSMRSSQNLYSVLREFAVAAVVPCADDDAMAEHNGDTYEDG